MFPQRWPERGMKAELVSASRRALANPARDPLCISGSVKLFTPVSPVALLFA